MLAGLLLLFELNDKLLLVLNPKSLLFLCDKLLLFLSCDKLSLLFNCEKLLLVNCYAYSKSLLFVDCVKILNPLLLLL